jgi:Cu/Ag efflux pump CusA
VTPAAATALALAPLIVTGTIPGQEIAHPIAIVVVGGLITTTLVTAFVLPALYATYGPRPAPAPESDHATT